MNEQVYAIYRRNLRRNQHLKPGKTRNLHHLERALFSWPAKLYVYWHHVKHKTKPTPDAEWTSPIPETRKEDP